ncbi:MAG: right-handed parallel beta-helix repeat-containing protein, partial [Synergistaceae bacterium]|nr:right-handed parallel beta-helix repeat-containing protein [Synergistaceae bacterium]
MFNMRRFCALFFVLLMWVNLAYATDIPVEDENALLAAVGTYTITAKTNTDGSAGDELTFTEGSAKDGDTIILTGGKTYTLTQTTKTLYVTKSLTFKSSSSTEKAILDGNNAVRVFRIGDNNHQLNVTLDGLKITNGKNGNNLNNGDNGDWKSEGDGAGVFIGTGSEVTIKNCEITSNTSDNGSQGWGGGIYVSSGISTVNDETHTMTYTKKTVLTLEDSKITQNTAAANGGGIHIGSGAEVTITNCEITGNTATNSYGGGIYMGLSEGTITNCNISNNTAFGLGGAISLWGSSVTITQSTLDTNKVTDSSWGYGGAICVQTNNNTPEIEITNSTISNNEATAGIGAIYSVGAKLTMTNCSVINNKGSLADLFIQDGVNTNFTNSLIWAATQDKNNINTGTVTNCAVRSLPDTITDPAPVTLATWDNPTSTTKEVNGITHTVYRIEDNSELVDLFGAGTTGEGIPTKDQLGNNRAATPCIGAVEGFKPVIATAEAQTITGTVGTEITTSATFTASDEGGDVIEWVITPDLPEGLTGTSTEDKKSYTISGTPTATQSETTYTVKAKNGVGESEGSATLKITINAAPITFQPTTIEETVTEGTAIDGITITPATGTATEAGWTVMPPLSNIGLSGAADGNSYKITGTPTNPSSTAYEFTINATNSTGQQAETPVTLKITVNEAAATLALTTSKESINATEGTAIESITITANEDVAEWSESGSLPSGIEGKSDGKTYTISGTPEVGSSTSSPYSYTVTAKNAKGHTAQATVTITVAAAAAPTLTTSAQSINATEGTAITAITITANEDVTWKTDDASKLPSGVTGTSSGKVFTIAGTPAVGTAKEEAYSYTVTATNNLGVSATSTVTITVSAVGSTQIIDITASTIDATEGTAIEALTIRSYAGTELTWKTSGDLPAGVKGAEATDKKSFIISGTPEAGSSAKSPYNYFITATNAAGDSEQAKITLTVKAAVVSPDLDITAKSINATEGEPIETITIKATKGDNLTWTTSGDLPAGITGKASGDKTFMISGTPATGTAGSYTCTVITTNTAGSAKSVIKITVAAKEPEAEPAKEYAPILSSTDIKITATEGEAITAFTITATSGDNLTWTADATKLPEGLTGTAAADNKSFTISGTPKQGSKGNYTYTVTASNTAGMASAKVSITVSGSGSGGDDEDKDVNDEVTTGLEDLAQSGEETTLEDALKNQLGLTEEQLKQVTSITIPDNITDLG